MVSSRRPGAPVRYREGGRPRRPLFGWMAFAPPRWWPAGRIPDAVLSRLAGLPPSPPGGDVTASDASGACVPPGLNPLTRQPEWVPRFGEACTVADALVGRGFDVYVRVLHPLQGAADDDGTPVVRWRDVPGATPDEAGWRPDRRPDGSIDYDGPWSEHLCEGTIPPDVRAALDEHLRASLVPGVDVVQGVFDMWVQGYAELTSVRIPQPDRDIVPLVGPFEGIAEFGWQTPALVFPLDGSWSLANDVDLVSTYLGCDEELAARVLADPRLECLRVNGADCLG